MKYHWRHCLYFLFLCAITNSNVSAQQIDAESYKSIVDSLQYELQDHPSVFPLESFDGGAQSIPQGLKAAYFGFGERRFDDRNDFHLSIDVAYAPLEAGDVETADGKSWTVRAPKTYLKKIYAIQDGLLVSAAKNSTGIKIILKHTLGKPYFDDEGHEYHDYYTSYRHVDSRSLDYLTSLAKQVLNSDAATFEDLMGNHVFKAGDVIAFAGFDPYTKTGYPRSHLDFSLHVFPDPQKGTNIRKYSLNPLLLFPVFEYGDPRTHQTGVSGLPVYRFVIDEDTIVAPRKGQDGKFEIAINAGGLTTDGSFAVTRYFALNSMQVTVFNDGRELATHTLDRDRRLGYDPSSYDGLDNPDVSRPYFDAPLGEQGDVYTIGAVLPERWLEDIGYDWSKDGSMEVKIGSIWDGSFKGHSKTFEIQLKAGKGGRP
ncbi:MAG: hypothetical protein WBS20_11105 [Lysobacterales bacterium]